jgi:hypothetical protein
MGRVTQLYAAFRENTIAFPSLGSIMGLEQEASQAEPVKLRTSVSMGFQFDRGT